MANEIEAAEAERRAIIARADAAYDDSGSRETRMEFINACLRVAGMPGVGSVHLAMESRAHEEIKTIAEEAERNKRARVMLDTLASALGFDVVDGSSAMLNIDDMLGVITALRENAGLQSARVGPPTAGYRW